ncbi:MAG: tripartite tricarboxylate transporter TctB family protein [Thermodesulfobacteriota bacterium]|jgi:putative tricarboxylic transport membrane protein
MRLDLISGFFWFSFSILAALGSYQLNLGSWQKPGSGFLPFGAACLLGIFSFIIFLQALWTEKRIAKGEAWPEPKGWPKAVLVLCTLLGYALCLERVGFIIATFLLLCLLLKTIEPQTWPKTIIFSFFGSLLSYLIFQTFLKAQLPAGLLAGLGF